MSFIRSFIFKRKLRSQLLLGFGLTLLISVIGITSVSVYYTTKSLEGVVNENLKDYTETTNDLLIELFNEEIASIINMAKTPSIRQTATIASEMDPLTDLWPTYEGKKWGDDSDSFGAGISARDATDINFDNDINPDISKYLLNILGTSSYSEIFFTDARGYAISSSGNTGDFAQGDEGWWQSAKKNNLNVGGFEFDESSKAFSIAFSVYIESSNSTKTGGPFAGVLKASYNFKSMTHLLNQLIIGDAGFTMVVTKEGDIIYDDDATNIGKNMNIILDNSTSLTLNKTMKNVQNEVFISDIEYFSLSNPLDLVHSDYANFINVDWHIITFLPQSEIDEVVQEPINASFFVSVLSFFILIAFSYFFSGTIVSRIKILVKSMIKGSEGDLTETEEDRQKLETISTGHDEISELSKSYIKLIDNIRLVVNSTQSSIFILNNTSEDMLSGTEEINASSEEVASTSQAMSDGATTQTELISDVNENVMMVQSIVDDIVKKIQMNTQEVSQIALQTNILALNAGIEASRAGDYGRGFAVVAENVRKLSDQSKMASERINSVADEIRETLLKSFNRISNTMIDVVSVSEETAASAEEVAAAAEEMTATIEELSSLAQELTRHADTTGQMINKFKVKHITSEDIKE